MPTIDEVLDALDQFHQRATYGALGGVVGRPAQSVMTGRPRNHFNSWVVRRDTGLPTGYTPAQMHPQLLARAHVINTPRALSLWLRNPN